VADQRVSSCNPNAVWFRSCHQISWGDPLLAASKSTATSSLSPSKPPRRTKTRSIAASAMIDPKVQAADSSTSTSTTAAAASLPSETPSSHLASSTTHESPTKRKSLRPNRTLLGDGERATTTGDDDDLDVQLELEDDNDNDDHDRTANATTTTLMTSSHVARLTPRKRGRAVFDSDSEDEDALAASSDADQPSAKHARLTE